MNRLADSCVKHKDGEQQYISAVVPSTGKGVVGAAHSLEEGRAPPTHPPSKEKYELQMACGT
jgi:hypothetical protein